MPNFILCSGAVLMIYRNKIAWLRWVVLYDPIICPISMRSLFGRTIFRVIRGPSVKDQSAHQLKLVLDVDCIAHILRFDQA